MTDRTDASPDAASGAVDDEALVHALDRLHAMVAARKGGDPEASYTARLLARGTPKIAQKLGEEAVEAVIEAVRADAARRGGAGGESESAAATDALVEESADMLYHLTVLWAALDVDPDRVWRALDARRGRGGLDEKKARKGG
ncbi:MAG: phosphoribosyl-ATP diphosphatase [Azospirillaceae bacterium]